MNKEIKGFAGRVAERVVAHLLETLFLVLAGLILIAWPLAESYLALQLGKLAPITIVRAGVVLCVLTLCSFAYALWQRPKLRVNQLLGGAMMDIKTGIPYCTNCYTKKIFSPLNDANDITLICNVVDCGQTYHKKIKYP